MVTNDRIKEQLHFDDGMLIDAMEMRERLLDAKDAYIAFADKIDIPEKAYIIDDSFGHMSIRFTIASMFRDDVRQHFEFSIYNSKDRNYRVEFKTPRISKDEMLDMLTPIENAYKDDDYSISFEYYNRKTIGPIEWAGSIWVSKGELSVEEIENAFERLRTVSTEIIRWMEIAFWSSCDKAKISTYEYDERDEFFDLAADYEVYEGRSVAGYESYLSVLTDIGHRDIVVDDYREKVVVKTTAWIEMTDDEKEYVYEIKPDDNKMLIRCLNDTKVHDRSIGGEIETIQEGRFYRYKIYKLSGCAVFEDSSIIVSIDDNKTIRFFLEKEDDSKSLLATMEASENINDKTIHDGEMLMHRKHIIHTKQYCAELLGLFTAIQYICPKKQ